MLGRKEVLNKAYVVLGAQYSKLRSIVSVLKKGSVLNRPSFPLKGLS